MKYGKNKIVSWGLGLLMALSVSIANAEQEILPLDVFVYMDNSDTVYAKKDNQPTPASQLVKMLETMFQQPLNEFGKPSFLGKGDRLYLKTFDRKVNELKPAINVKGVESWKQAFDQMSKGTHRNSIANRSALKITNMATLFGFIAEDSDLTSNDGRQKIVLIASDFINDTTNTSKQICDESNRIKSGKKASTDKTIEGFSKAIASIRTKGTPVYLGFLEVSATASNTKYGKCLAKLLPFRPITTQLEFEIKEGNITGDVIQFKQNQKDLGKFAAKLMDRIVTATLPPTRIKSAELILGIQPQIVRLKLVNEGLKPLSIVGIDYYSSDGESAKILDQYKYRSAQVIGKGEIKEIKAEVPQSVVSRAQLNTDANMFVSIRDSSPKTGDRILRKRLKIIDKANIDISQAFVNDDRTALNITAVVNNGGAKTPKYIVVRVNGNEFGEFELPDLIGGAIKANSSRDLQATDLDGRISELPWLGKIEVAIKSNQESDSSSLKYFKVTMPDLGEKPKIISAQWLPVVGEIGKWKAEFEIENPKGNPLLSVTGKVLMASVAGDKVYSCELEPVSMRQGPSTSMSYCAGMNEFSSETGVAATLLQSRVIKVELVTNNNESIDLSNAVDLVQPKIGRLIIDQKATGIKVKDNESILSVTVINPNLFINNVRAIEITQNNGATKNFTSEVRGKEVNVINGQPHEVYLLYDSDGVSEFVPRGEPFSIRVQNLAGVYSVPITIENPAQEPLKIVPDKSSQKWSSKEAALKLRVRNDSGFEQKDPVFAVYSTRDGVDYLVKNLKPIGITSIPKNEEADVAVNFSNQDLLPLFESDNDSFYMCVVKSSSRDGKDGCDTRYRAEINLPNKENGREGGVVVLPHSGKGVKFSNGQYLYLDLENKDPYPITINSLQLLNPQSRQIAKSKLTLPLFIAPFQTLKSQRVSLAKDDAWNIFNPGSVRLAVNNFGFGGEVSFDPVDVKIKGHWVQRSPIDGIAGDKYLVRVDLDIFNNTRERLRKNAFIDVQILHKDNPIGLPVSKQVSMDSEKSKIQSTLYFKVEDWNDRETTSLYAQATIRDSQQAPIKVEIKEAFYDLYALSWTLSGYLFIAFASFLIYMQRTALGHFWSQAWLKTGAFNEWIKAVKWLWQILNPFHPNSVFYIFPLIMYLYQFFGGMDPSAAALKFGDDNQSFWLLLPPFLVLILFSMTFVLKKKQHADIKKVRRDFEAKDAKRIPISRSRPDSILSSLRWGLLGAVVGLIIYIFVFAPLNSPIYSWFTNSDSMVIQDKTYPNNSGTENKPAKQIKATAQGDQQ